MNNLNKIYNQILKSAKKDPNILGLILTGGRGKNFITEYSDYDIFLIVKDGVIKKYKNKYKKAGEKVDVFVHVLSKFKNYANFGSETEWDRYNFAHLKAQVDKIGIQKIINSKSILPNNYQRKIVEDSLDGYINLFYRSLKNKRDGNNLASKMDAAESIPYFLAAIFALNKKVRPYNKYLNWELRNYPLKITAWPASTLLKDIELIISTGNIKAQKNLFIKSKKLFYNKGFKKSIDNWKNTNLHSLI